MDLRVWDWQKTGVLEIQPGWKLMVLESHFILTEEKSEKTVYNLAQPLLSNNSVENKQC